MNLAPIPISKERFFEIYKEVPKESITKTAQVLFLKDINISNLHELNEESLRVLLSSKLWRLNNLYTIIDRFSKESIFRMNEFQHIVYSEHLKHPRNIILKSRQLGISTFWLVSFFDDILFKKNLTCGLMSHTLPASAQLLERVKLLWDKFPTYLKDIMKIRNTSSNESKFKMSIGDYSKATLLIRTSFRGDTLHQLHISELGKIANEDPKKARETQTGTMLAITAGQPVIIESTAEGTNMFKEYWDTAWDNKLNNVELSGLDYSPIFLSWLSDPFCKIEQNKKATLEEEGIFAEIERETKIKLERKQKNFFITKHKELKHDIFREYPATPAQAFQNAEDPKYWAKDYEHKCLREGKVTGDIAINPDFPVYVAQDIGLSDYYVILYFQYYWGNLYLLESFKDTGKYAEVYADMILSKNKISFQNKIQTVIFPHDAMKQSVASSSAVSVYHVFLRKGITNTRVLTRQPVQQSIENVRKEIPHMFVNKGACRYIHECLLNYSKEFDKVNKIFKKTPKHNAYSHGADALRYAVQFVQENLKISGNYKARGSKGYGI